MIISYGWSIAGTSHIRRNKPCQDSHRIIRLENNWTIAAIADGVGSAKKAERGSKLAVDTVAEFCVDNLPFDGNVESMKFMLITGFNRSMREIIKLARSEGNPVEDYDTTLTVVIYNGHKILYGHVGDGGIIGLTSGGKYMPITEPQKSEDGMAMIPLRFGYKYWVFDNLTDEFAAVLLATDGLYENYFMPKILKLQEEKIYIGVIRPFMDKNYLEINESNQQEKKDYLYSILSNDEFEYVTDDDKTIVVMINDEIDVIELESSYYEMPDWETLKQIQYNKLYLPKDKNNVLIKSGEIVMNNQKHQNIQESCTDNKQRFDQDDLEDIVPKTDKFDLIKCTPISSRANEIEKPFGLKLPFSKKKKTKEEEKTNWRF